MCAGLDDRDHPGLGFHARPAFQVADTPTPSKPTTRGGGASYTIAPNTHCPRIRGVCLPFKHPIPVLLAPALTTAILCSRSNHWISCSPPFILPTGKHPPLQHCPIFISQLQMDCYCCELRSGRPFPTANAFTRPMLSIPCQYLECIAIAKGTVAEGWGAGWRTLGGSGL